MGSSDPVCLLGRIIISGPVKSGVLRILVQENARQRLERTKCTARALLYRKNIDKQTEID